MEKIIQYVQERIDCCVGCNYQDGCSWFVNVASNTGLNDITTEENAQLTYEEIAIKVHCNAGETLCHNQYTLDTILQHVDGMLEDASIPNFSQLLITLFNRMSRLERRLKRLPSKCLNVFETIIYAVEERCLAEIDYRFLDAGVDICPLIMATYPHYKRARLLHQHYLPDVVDFYLSRAKKPSFEQILAWKGPLWEMRDLGSSHPLSSVNKDAARKEPFNDQSGLNQNINDDKFHLLIPPGISALEEVKLRFAGHQAKYPISSFLIRAGYEQYVVCIPDDIDLKDYREWAMKHSEDCYRYLFNRWDELKEEVSNGIKSRVKDRLELKKYVCGLLTPFDYFDYYNPFRFDTKEFAEPLEIISCFIGCGIFSVEEFIKQWRKMVVELHHDDEIEDYSFDDYRLQLWNRSSSMVPENESDDERKDWEAFTYRWEFPARYCGLIAGCLLENGAPLEFMDYQDMCGVELVKYVESDDIMQGMNWTEELVFSYNPKRVIRSEHFTAVANPELNMTDDNSSGSDDVELYVLPAIFERAKEYLDVLKDNGYLNSHYKWANKEGSLNYHAAWASKIISHNCNPSGISKEKRITHDMVGKLFGIPNLGTYVTDAKNKPTVTGLIERLFEEKGLPILLS